MRCLALAVQNIYGNKDHSQLHARQKQIDHLDPVGKLHTQPVAAGEAARPQSLGHSITPRVDLPECVLALAPLERGLVAPAQKRNIKELVKIHSAAPRSIIPAISASAYPSSCRTCRVCSPMPGALPGRRFSIPSMRIGFCTVLRPGSISAKT